MQLFLGSPECHWWYDYWHGHGDQCCCDQRFCFWVTAAGNKLRKVSVSDTTVAIGDDDAALTATALSAIGGATTGTANAVAINGSASEMTAALVTDASKVSVMTPRSRLTMKMQQL